MKTIQDILSTAKIDANGKLDESIVAELQTVIDEIVDLKVKDKANQLLQEHVNPVVEQTKEELTTEYENKFEEFKDSVAEKFSVFCDQVLDEELQIPEHIQEWAAKGQLYAPILETLRAQMAIEDGAVNEQVKEIMQESKSEIERLREELNKQISENVNSKSVDEDAVALLKEAREDIAILKAINFVHENYGYLSKAKKDRIVKLIPTSVIMESGEALAKEVDFIVHNIVEDVNSMGNDKPLGQEKTPIQAELEKKCACPVCGKVIDVADTNVACSTIKCPDCADTYLVDAPVTENKKEEKVKEPYGVVNEDYINRAAAIYAQLID